MGVMKDIRKLDASQSDVTFYNVKIVISGAKSPQNAYDRLCDALASMEVDDVAVEWTTRTYTKGTGPERSTMTLFPKDGNPREKRVR